MQINAKCLAIQNHFVIKYYLFIFQYHWNDKKWINVHCSSSRWKYASLIQDKNNSQSNQERWNQNHWRFDTWCENSFDQNSRICNHWIHRKETTKITINFLFQTLQELWQDHAKTMLNGSVTTQNFATIAKWKPYVKDFDLNDIPFFWWFLKFWQMLKISRFYIMNLKLICFLVISMSTQKSLKKCWISFWKYDFFK